MKRNTIIAALMTLMIAITLTLAGGSYAANQTTTSTTNNSVTEKIATMQQNQTKIQEAIKNNDYTTWKTLMTNTPRGNKNTDQATFDKMVANQKLHTDIQTAINNSDYTTWKTLIAKSPNATEMTNAIKSEADFTKFVAAHKLIEQGRATMQKGQTQLQELGITRPNGKFGQGFKMGMKEGMGKKGGMWGKGAQ